MLPISLPPILPPLSAASTADAFSVTLISPCALLIVNLPSSVPSSTEPVFVPITTSPFAPSAVLILAEPIVAFSALTLPPLSVASILVAEVVTLMSPCALFAISSPSSFPTLTEPSAVLLSIRTFPVPDTATLSTVTVPSVFDIVRSALLSVALTAFADSQTRILFWASLAVNTPSMLATTISPVLESTVKSPLNKPFASKSVSSLRIRSVPLSAIAVFLMDKSPSLEIFCPSISNLPLTVATSMPPALATSIVPVPSETVTVSVTSPAFIVPPFNLPMERFSSTFSETVTFPSSSPIVASLICPTLTSPTTLSTFTLPIFFASIAVASPSAAFALISLAVIDSISSPETAVADKWFSAEIVAPAASILPFTPSSNFTVVTFSSAAPVAVTLSESRTAPSSIVRVPVFASPPSKTTPSSSILAEPETLTFDTGFILVSPS